MPVARAVHSHEAPLAAAGVAHELGREVNIATAGAAGLDWYADGAYVRWQRANAESAGKRGETLGC